MSDPTTEVIPRKGRGTNPDDHRTGPPAAWADVGALLAAARSTCWLSVRGRHGGVHTRPVFAAWTGSTFVVATNPAAAKTRDLESDGSVSVAVDLGALHVVVEATASRLTRTADLERASATFSQRYDWPTEVAGDLLDAPYAAPTSGGPPFQAWELTPVTVFAFPTEDQVEPTKFGFGASEGR